MFKLNLIIRRKGDNTMILSPAPWFRIAFLIIAAVLISGMIVAFTDNGESSIAVPIIIAVICILASLYEESWTFNRERNSIIWKTGLLPISRIREFSFPEVETLELMTIIRGGGPVKDKKTDPDPPELSKKRIKTLSKKYHQELRVNFKSGESCTIETFDGYSRDILKTKAWVLSDFCGFQLTD